MYWQSFFKSFCLLRAEARKKRTVFIKKVQRQLHFLLVFSTRVEKLSLHLAFIYNIGVELPHLMASNPCALAEQPIEIPVTTSEANTTMGKPHAQSSMPLMRFIPNKLAISVGNIKIMLTLVICFITPDILLLIILA